LAARDRGVQRFRTDPGHHVASGASIDSELLRNDQTSWVIEIGGGVVGPGGVRPALEGLILPHQHAVMVWEDQRLGDRNGKRLRRGSGVYTEGYNGEPKAIHHGYLPAIATPLPRTP